MKAINRLPIHFEDGEAFSGFNCSVLELCAADLRASYPDRFVAITIGDAIGESLPVGVQPVGIIGKGLPGRAAGNVGIREGVNPVIERRADHHGLTIAVRGRAK